MNSNPWEFGYEAIGAIAGALALVVTVIAEWDKLSERHTLWGAIFTIFLVGGGYAIGYGISQPVLWWRLVSLGLGALLGAFFGVLFGDEDTYKGKVVVLVLATLAGIVAGLLLSN